MASLPSVLPGVKTEKFSFVSKGVEFSGLIEFPETSSGPFPAILFVWGSGPVDITNPSTRKWCCLKQRKAFTSNGVACVMWDKAGCGGSGGDWRRQLYDDDRAQEVADAITVLCRRKDVDSSRIGLWGISQGGWVCPAAFSKSNRISFLIVVSGAGKTVLSQNIYLLRSNLALNGVTPSDVEKIMGAFEPAARGFSEQGNLQQAIDTFAPILSSPLYQKIVKTGIAPNLPGFLRSLIVSCSFLAPLMQKVPFLRSFLKATRHNLLIDAESYWEHVTCPVLAQFGEKDSLVNWRESIEVYREALRRAGNRDLTIQTYPGTDHFICYSPSGSLYEMTRRKSTEWHSPPYEMDEIDWLRARGFISQ